MTNIGSLIEKAVQTKDECGNIEIQFTFKDNQTDEETKIIKDFLFGITDEIDEDCDME